MSVVEIAARPIVKWAGGKTALLSSILPMLPLAELRGGRVRYFEPFLGGGAVFFAISPALATLSDANADLVDMYNAIRTMPDLVLGSLEAFAAHHSEEKFYELRALYNDRREKRGFERGTMASHTRAALFLYLNKTCFNGLYRVNRNGAFNVPCGRPGARGTVTPASAIVNRDEILAANRALRGSIEIVSDDYASVVSKSVAGDVVYFDPPYDGTFAGYSSDGFDEDNQRELADVCRGLAQRGVHVVASNNDTALVRSIYEGFELHSVTAPRSINARGGSRGHVNELLIVAPKGGVS